MLVFLQLDRQMRLKSKIFNKYLLPGFVFQSVIMAGGYATGREIVEFFLTLGPRSGLLAMLISALVWSIVCLLTFEFARYFKAYDYRTFFKKLLGNGWILFEMSYLAVIIIVLSVIAASSGNIISMTLGLPYNVGVVGLVVYVCFMVFKGTRAIEIMMSFWSIMLYLVYFVFLTACIINYGPQIKTTFQSVPNEGGWLLNGIRYAGYNLGLIPAVLFSLTYIQTRKEAVTAGIMAGVVAIIPGIFFFIAMLGQYPAVVEQEIPSTFILQQIGSPPLTLIFHVILFGTLIETGTGLIHALNERARFYWQEKGLTMPSKVRPIVAFVCLTLAALIAQFGLSPLIAKGYGTLTWVIILVYVLPIMSVGLYKLSTR
tara:strand:- start:26682 stop:27797 length:1116 start_codon:yes stop_codon:yes gene_type:complete